MAEVCGLYGKEEVLWQSEPWDARAVAECDCVCVCVCVCVLCSDGRNLRCGIKREEWLSQEESCRVREFSRIDH